MDIWGCSCLTWRITACRSGTEVAATLFLTQHSPLPTVHKSVLIQPLWLRVLGSLWVLLAQTRPLPWHHIPVASATPCLLLADALDILDPGVSRRWPVAEQSSV